MKRYYHISPRNFCNEYTVYVVPAEEVARFEKLIPDADRISRAEAIRLGISRPAEAKRDGEQWFGGFVSGRLQATGDWRKLCTVAGKIEAAVADTLDEMHQIELNQDCEVEMD